MVSVWFEPAERSTRLGRNGWVVYLKALQPAHIHHVVATFWHKAHHLDSFLFRGQRGTCLNPSKKVWIFIQTGGEIIVKGIVDPKFKFHSFLVNLNRELCRILPDLMSCESF